MEKIKLAALRDFAIAHIPRAQQVRNQKHPSQDNYHVALYGTAALVLAASTATGTEQAAALLLQLATSLMIQWDTDNKLNARQRYDIAQEAISAARGLCALTNTSLTWLSDAIADEAPPAPLTLAPAPPSNQTLQVRLPAPTPGINLSTKEAAEYLGVKVQTMHKWSSMDTGPLRPIHLATGKLGWPSDEVIRFMQGK